MSGDRNEDKGVVLTPTEEKRRRGRSLAIGLALGALVLLFYVVTMAKIGMNIHHKPM